ncbi:MAG: RelA/SpoT domain-containing protein [Alphaproteobacteria bacterium]
MTDEFRVALDELEHEERSYRSLCMRIQAQLEDNPELEIDGLHCVHSVRWRKKSHRSMLDKCKRKKEKGILIDEYNVFDEIEDFFGIRVLHLHFDQVGPIHSFLCKRVDDGEFVFGEQPKAYTWDPESTDHLRELGFEVEFRESFYTSLHYILRASETSRIRCEVQVRTLFEEAWGELDHWMNYPKKTDNLALKEQILVLSKLVSAGSRLAVAINRTYKAGLSEAPQDGAE